jgi:hypothetical protein
VAAQIHDRVALGAVEDGGAAMGASSSRWTVD